MNNDISRALVKHIANTTYESLPEEAIITAKKSILDTLGIMFPATTLSPTSDVIHAIYADFDNAGPCTIVGYGGTASPLGAAMVNGSLTHAVDFDDDAGAHKPITHPTAGCFPAALAMSEYAGNVSGKDLICAIALADDVGLRIGDAVNGNILFDYDFFPPTVLGVMLATVACCKVLKLDEEKTLNALGLAVNRVSGIRDALFGGEFRSIRDAFGNEEGVRCALMAQRGLDGCEDPIEQLYHTVYHDKVDLDIPVKNLGQEYYNAKHIGYKPWPSCHGTHPYLQSVLEVIERDDIRAEDIERIDLTGCEQGANLFNPKEEKSSPTTPITAKIAIPYVVAVAACRRGVGLADFEVQNLGDEEVHEMTKRIFFTEDNTYPPNSATARIVTKDGAVHEGSVDILRGSVNNPMSFDELVDKFKRNVELAYKPIPPEAQERLLALLIDLDDVANIDEITQLLR